LLYLENSKFLVRRCCLSGKLEERFFLSKSLKFNEMITEPESGTITLKSTRIKDTGDGDAVFTIAVFSSPPLKFVAMFEVY
jgi:DDB1- and CUL4-associated factor 17